jgi:uncharacterized HhH-GPD family protein
MSEKTVCDKLVEKGKQLFDAPKEELIALANSREADKLLNDLAAYPHAYVLACLMDRQMKYARAWQIPYKISQKIGGFSIETLSKLALNQIKELMSEPEPLHRFHDTMSSVFYSAIQRINDVYGGDASRIWAGRPSSSEAVYRFLQFDGAGPKIATMAVNILARDFKIDFADFFSVDISADVHVRRVFARLGLCRSNASVEEVIYKARALNPQFPGMIDLPCWDIGKKWCKPRDPECASCYMKELCPTASTKN